MFLLAIHLSILGTCVVITFRLYSLSYLVICFSKNLMDPLSRVFIMECH